MHTPEVWKNLFMHACGHAVQFEHGLDGKPFPVGFRSSRLTKAEMSDLMEFVTEYGTRHGVRWTDPAYGEAALVTSSTSANTPGADPRNPRNIER
jgi:phage-related protein